MFNYSESQVSRWKSSRAKLTQPHAAVLEQVAQVVEHGFLVLAADAAEVAQEAAAAGHHLGEGDLLQTRVKAAWDDQLSVTGKRVKMDQKVNVSEIVWRCCITWMENITAKVLQYKFQNLKFFSSNFCH